MRDAAELFPQRQGTRPLALWAGMIDVTLDQMTVLGPVDGTVPLLATGSSGHGIDPAASYVMAQLAQDQSLIVDHQPFCFTRFHEGDVLRWLVP